MNRLLGLVLLLGLGACFGMPAYMPTAANNVASDEALIQQLNQAKLAADAAPADAQLAINYAAMLAAVFQAEVPSRGQLDGNIYLDDACRALDRAATARPNELARLEMQRGYLFDSAGMSAEALRSYEASLNASPGLSTLSLAAPHLLAQNRVLDFDTYCRASLDHAATNSERYQTLYVCASARPQAASIEQMLPWANASERQFFVEKFEAEQAAIAAEAERLAAEQREREAASAASWNYSESYTYTNNGHTTTQSSSSSSASSDHASVSLSNRCSKTVRLFFGDKPKYGSGRYTTLSANSSTSYSMRAGDMIWIVDESDNGLSSTSVPAGSSRIEILSSCSGFSFR